MKNLNLLDMYNIDNILSYLKINETIFLNKMYYINGRKGLKLNIYKICNFYIYNRNRLSMEFDNLTNLNIVHNYYILFYPKEYKIDLMRLGITKLLNIISLDVYETLLNYYNNVMTYSNYIESTDIELPNYINYKNKFINKYFKLYIKSLNINQLAILGW